MYMSVSQTVVITVQVEWKFPLLDRETAAKRAARCKKKTNSKMEYFQRTAGLDSRAGALWKPFKSDSDVLNFHGSLVL